MIKMEVKVHCHRCKVQATLTEVASTKPAFVESEARALLAAAGCVHEQAKQNATTARLLRELREGKA